MATRYDALAYMKRYDWPVSCTEVGEALYCAGHRTRQAYARPGGRLLHMLKREGLVIEVHVAQRFRWVLTDKGREFVAPG